MAHNIHFCGSKFQFTPLREGRRSTSSQLSTISGVFQFTPLREGRPPSSPANPARQRFQFTPLREGRPKAACTWTANSLFQFTPLREGRRVRLWMQLNFSNFNSRPCVRGDQKLSNGQKTTTSNFNSRPCVRGDTAQAVKECLKLISIHAPA